MPTYPIQLKRNGTAAATPSSLLHGEVALNYADGKLFWKDASNVIQSFTFQAYALSSHTHAASDITSGTLDAARLPLATTIAAGAVIVGTGLGVSSGTVSVTYGTNSTSACRGDDSRLSDTRTPTDGSVTTAKLANDAVTYAKIQNVSTTDRLLGRSSAGAGDVEEITCTAFGRSLIDDADAAAARTTLSVQPTASPAFTGAATVSSGNIGVSTSVGSAPTNGTAHALLLTSTTTAAVNVGPAVFFKGQTGNNTADYGFAGIQGVKDSSSSQNYAGALVFFVQTGGGSSALSEAMRCRTDHSTGAVLTVMAGQLQVTAGSGSAGSYKPGVAVSGDDDTGLQQVGGAGTISIVTQGSERVRVDASGTVGIASASTAATYAGWLRIGPMASSSLSSNGGLEFVNAASSSGWGWRISNLDAGGGAVPLVFESRSNSTSWAERIRISESGSITAAQVYSDTVGATNRDLFIDNTGKLGYVSSIRASKTNIAAIDDVSWLRDLTPVSFHYRKRNEDGTYSDDPDGTLDYGLIAEEVEPVAPEMCFYDVVDGEPQLRGVHYSKLITPMLRYIQQLEQRIAALEERLNHA